MYHATLYIYVINNVWRDELGREKLFNNDSKVVYFLQGQQLMDLEHKLAIAKDELEKTALDKVNDRKNITSE